MTFGNNINNQVRTSVRIKKPVKNNPERVVRDTSNKERVPIRQENYDNFLGGVDLVNSPTPREASAADRIVLQTVKKHALQLNADFSRVETDKDGKIKDIIVRDRTSKEEKSLKRQIQDRYQQGFISGKVALNIIADFKATLGAFASNSFLKGLESLTDNILKDMVQQEKEKERFLSYVNREDLNIVAVKRTNVEEVLKDGLEEKKIKEKEKDQKVVALNFRKENELLKDEIETITEEHSNFGLWPQGSQDRLSVTV